MTEAQIREIVRQELASAIAQAVPIAAAAAARIVAQSMRRPGLR